MKTVRKHMARKWKIVAIGLFSVIAVGAWFFISEERAFDHLVQHSKPNFSMNLDINHQAPVISSAEIKVDAPIEIVWETLTSVDQWPNWQKEVTATQLLGEMEEGAAFKWKAGGIPFTSVVHTMRTPRSFGWTGKTMGASAIHNWRLSEGPDGTLVLVEESLQGVLPRLFSRYFQRSLTKGMEENLRELKTEAEKRNEKRREVAMESSG